MNTNVIINADNIETMRQYQDNSIDLIFADPPYWMQVEGTLNRAGEGGEFDGCDDDWDKFTSIEAYQGFTRKWLSECQRILKKDGSFWVIGSMQCIYLIGSIMQELGFWIVNDVIWAKTNPTPNFSGTRLCNSHETLIWATKGKGSKFTFNYKTGRELNHDNVTDAEYAKGIRKQMGSVWRIPVCQGTQRLKDDNGNKLHSTQKPEELLYRIIALTSHEGDIVLDPFGGTMTTCAVAKKLGRKYIGIERDTKYCLYGKRRVDAIGKYVPDDISTAKLDEKPLKVTIADMMADGFLTDGESVTIPGYEEETAGMTLMTNGHVFHDGESESMHSLAAKVRKVKAARLNGFDYWCVMRDGKPETLGSVRERYRAWRKQQK